MSEERMQKSVMQEVALRANQDERWRYLYHCPNGGARNKIVAGKLKAQGVRPGVPDLCLPIPRPAQGQHPAYHGLYLELKWRDNDTTLDQVRWQRFLAAQGYYVASIRDDPQQVIDTIAWYLGEER